MRRTEDIALGLAATRAHLDDALDAVAGFGRGRDGPGPVDEALCQAIASLDEVYAQWSDLLEEQRLRVVAVPPHGGLPAGPVPGPPAVSRRRRFPRLWQRW